MNSYEFLKYLTVSLSARKFADKKQHTCTATGFYAIIKNCPVIVTAKHFATSTEAEITISGHYKDNGNIISIPITTKVDWICSSDYDIAYCNVQPIATKFKEITGKEMFYTAITEKDIISKVDSTNISILSEILTLGYPMGLSSTHHEFPLFKKGHIASLPSDFTEDGQGYLDLCAEEGYSGSPVLLNNSQLKLIGVLVKCVGNTKSTTIYVSADKILEIE